MATAAALTCRVPGVAPPATPATRLLLEAAVEGVEQVDTALRHRQQQRAVQRELEAGKESARVDLVLHLPGGKEGCMQSAAGRRGMAPRMQEAQPEGRRRPHPGPAAAAAAVTVQPAAAAHREGGEGAHAPVAGVVQLDHAALSAHGEDQALLVKGGGGQPGGLQQRLAAVHTQVPQPNLQGGDGDGVCASKSLCAGPVGDVK